MFSVKQMQSAQDRMTASRGRAITIKVNTGTGFTEYASRAVFGSLTDRDLIPGSSIRQGDIKLIISSTDWPEGVPFKLQTKDRVSFDGEDHSVVMCDPYSRMIGEHRVATDLVVRG
jgi:hypothetical protein